LIFPSQTTAFLSNWSSTPEADRRIGRRAA
jgi:hypothetical protein